MTLSVLYGLRLQKHHTSLLFIVCVEDFGLVSLYLGNKNNQSVAIFATKSPTEKNYVSLC